ncbi:type I-E CRISPR-associated protein Cas6/Cse3/CasE [Actinomadura kijaniata]|uniref:CRISPR system Cascade subunit CasE n=1 Tax=Actinomadura namibiensis TaxID=182080 RepID=A0A7W3M0D5_ACTNM|nr:type I-E CRISPR-associated protein Cas6/Cse3/CasE [Actinomadura namibiensis]MBA8957694.1 CRISPR system Cascade subunit CasE [Actinomadura namibiensis]
MNTDLWITQIVPDLRDQTVMADLRDVGRLHRRIMSLFPDDLGSAPRSQAAVLFRLEEAPSGFTLLMQSALQPDLRQLPAFYGNARCKALAPLLNHLHSGATVHYRIVANATRKLGKNTTAGRPKAVVPLHGAEADQWWVRQAETIGLLLHNLQSAPLSDATGRRNGTHKMTHARTRFDGTATVTDPTALIQHLRTGIGRGKSFGCGLLTLAPATR